MKILIVTAWYSPFIHPRAHRWTAIAEYWANEGHEVHVLTARLRERRSSEVLQGVQVHRVGFDSLKEWVYYLLGSRGARGRVGLKPKKTSQWAKFAAWVYKSIWKNLFFPDDACLWYFPAKRKLRQLLKTESFDAVITVSLPFTGHLLGLTLNLNPPSRINPPFWVADIGDPFSFQAKPPNNDFFYQKQNRRLERKVLETADAVTVTSKATLHKYYEQFGEKAVAKMTVIPPLLTRAPISHLQSTHPQSTHLQSANLQSTNLQSTNPQLPIPQSPATNPPIPTKIGYFGALYAPTRTPEAFLGLLEQTFAIRPDLRTRIEIHFYGEIFPEFFELLSAEPCIQLHGLCSREEVRSAMQEVDVLLNIGNATDFQLPSKAVEYLATGKPVLNLSYVKNDPFAEFFRGNSLVFQLNVENGRVDNAELDGWIEWLEGEKPYWTEAEIAGHIAPFLVEHIAERYHALIVPAALAARSDS